MTNPPADNNGAHQPPNANANNNGQQTPPAGGQAGVQGAHQSQAGYAGYPPHPGQPYPGYPPQVPYGYPQYPGYPPHPGAPVAAGQVPPVPVNYYPPAGHWPTQPPHAGAQQPPVPGMQAATGQISPINTSMPGTIPTAETTEAVAPPAPVKIDPNATGTLAGRDENYFTIPPHPNTQFDEVNFLKLLEGSISLTLPEKQKVIDAIPRLSIEQINELIKIFEEEKEKFKELESQYGEDVAKLKKQREAEFTVAEVNQEEESEAEAEAREAAELKRKLLGDQ